MLFVVKYGVDLSKVQKLFLIRNLIYGYSYAKRPTVS